MSNRYGCLDCGRAVADGVDVCAECCGVADDVCSDAHVDPDDVVDGWRVEMMRRAVYTLAGGLYVHRREEGYDVFKLWQGVDGHFWVYGEGYGRARSFGATLTPATWARRGA